MSPLHSGAQPTADIIGSHIHSLTFSQHKTMELSASPSRESKLSEHYAKSRKDKQKISIVWKDLNYSILTKDTAKTKPFFPVYKNKRILRSMHGKVSSGELLAIMGPTGKVTKFLQTSWCHQLYMITITFLSSSHRMWKDKSTECAGGQSL